MAALSHSLVFWDGPAPNHPIQQLVPLPSNKLVTVSRPVGGPSHLAIWTRNGSGDDRRYHCQCFYLRQSPSHSSLASHPPQSLNAGHGTSVDEGVRMIGKEATANGIVNVLTCAMARTVTIITSVGLVEHWDLSFTKCLASAYHPMLMQARAVTVMQVSGRRYCVVQYERDVSVSVVNQSFELVLRLSHSTPVIALTNSTSSTGATSVNDSHSADQFLVTACEDGSLHSWSIDSTMLGNCHEINESHPRHAGHSGSVNALTIPALRSLSLPQPYCQLLLSPNLSSLLLVAASSLTVLTVSQSQSQPPSLGLSQSLLLASRPNSAVWVTNDSVVVSFVNGSIYIYSLLPTISVRCSLIHSSPTAVPVTLHYHQSDDAGSVEELLGGGANGDVLHWYLSDGDARFIPPNHTSSLSDSFVALPPADTNNVSDSVSMRLSALVIDSQRSATSPSMAITLIRTYMDHTITFTPIIQSSLTLMMTAKVTVHRAPIIMLLCYHSWEIGLNHSIVVSGDRDGTVCIWHSSRGALVHSFALPTQLLEMFRVRSIVHAPTAANSDTGNGIGRAYDNFIVISCVDQSLRLFSLSSMSLVSVLRGHSTSAAIVSVSVPCHYSESDTLLVLTSDNTLYVWSISDGALIDVLYDGDSERLRTMIENDSLALPLSLSQSLSWPPSARSMTMTPLSASSSLSSSLLSPSGSFVVDYAKDDEDADSGQRTESPAIGASKTPMNFFRSLTRQHPHSTPSSPALSSTLTVNTSTNTAANNGGVSAASNGSHKRNWSLKQGIGWLTKNIEHAKVKHADTLSAFQRALSPNHAGTHADANTDSHTDNGSGDRFDWPVGDARHEPLVQYLYSSPQLHVSVASFNLVAWLDFTKAHYTSLYATTHLHGDSSSDKPFVSMMRGLLGWVLRDAGLSAVETLTTALGCRPATERVNIATSGLISHLLYTPNSHSHTRTNNDSNSVSDSEIMVAKQSILTTSLLFTLLSVSDPLSLPHFATIESQLSNTTSGNIDTLLYYCCHSHPQVNNAAMLLLKSRIQSLSSDDRLSLIERYGAVVRRWVSSTSLSRTASPRRSRSSLTLSINPGSTPSLSLPYLDYSDPDTHGDGHSYPSGSRHPSLLALLAALFLSQSFHLTHSASRRASDSARRDSVSGGGEVVVTDTNHKPSHSHDITAGLRQAVCSLLIATIQAFDARLSIIGAIHAAPSLSVVIDDTVDIVKARLSFDQLSLESLRALDGLVDSDVDDYLSMTLPLTSHPDPSLALSAYNFLQLILVRKPLLSFIALPSLFQSPSLPLSLAVKRQAVLATIHALRSLPSLAWDAASVGLAAVLRCIREEPELVATTSEAVTDAIRIVAARYSACDYHEASQRLALTAPPATIVHLYHTNTGERYRVLDNTLTGTNNGSASEVVIPCAVKFNVDGSLLASYEPQPVNSACDSAVRIWQCDTSIHTSTAVHRHGRQYLVKTLNVPTMLGDSSLNGTMSLAWASPSVVQLHHSDAFTLTLNI